MRSLRAIAALLVLLPALPLVPAAPPPAHEGVGMALATQPGAPTCTIPVAVVLVDSLLGAEYVLQYDAKMPDNCPGTLQAGVSATGSPFTGFTWSLGCESGSLGPLGDDTPFQVQDACTGLLVQGTLDFSLVKLPDAEVPAHPAYQGEGNTRYAEGPEGCLDWEATVSASWDPRGFWSFDVLMTHPDGVLGDPGCDPFRFAGFPAYGSPETGFSYDAGCLSYRVGPLGPATTVSVVADWGPNCMFVSWEAVVAFAPVA